MFELVHSNSNGEFKIKLNRDLSNKEIMEICQLATNLVPCNDKPASVNNEATFGPKTAEDCGKGQTKLGERPVDHIEMGTYQEPKNGVRIKILHMIENNRVMAFKTFRDNTGISLMGCKDIIYGNYACPILPLDKAEIIMECFKSINLHAKIVPVNETITTA